MMGGRGQTIGVVLLGTVVAWVLSVGLSIVALDVFGDPPAIVALLPGEELPQVLFWDRVWGPRLGPLVVASLGIAAASFAGGALVCRLMRRAGGALLLLPSLGALVSPAVLKWVYLEDGNGVAVVVVASLLGALLAQGLAARFSGVVGRGG